VAAGSDRGGDPWKRWRHPDVQSEDKSWDGDKTSSAVIPHGIGGRIAPSKLKNNNNNFDFG